LYDLQTFPTLGSQFVAVEAAINCCAVSEVFHLVAFVSADDRLHLLESSNLRQRLVIQLPLAGALRMLITQSWGFIVIDFGHEIVVFTVNGREIGRRKHDSDIVFWMSITSRSDFDYVVFAMWNGDLVIFEAGMPENTAKLAHDSAPVCGIAYDRPRDQLIAVTTTGKLSFLSGFIPRHAE
jgi:hypothetical protein